MERQPIREAHERRPVATGKRPIQRLQTILQVHELAGCDAPAQVKRNDDVRQRRSYATSVISRRIPLSQLEVSGPQREQAAPLVTNVSTRTTSTPEWRVVCAPAGRPAITNRWRDATMTLRAVSLPHHRDAARSRQRSRTPTTALGVHHRRSACLILGPKARRTSAWRQAIAFPPGKPRRGRRADWAIGTSPTTSAKAAATATSVADAADRQERVGGGSASPGSFRYSPALLRVAAAR